MHCKLFPTHSNVQIDAYTNREEDSDAFDDVLASKALNRIEIVSKTTSTCDTSLLKEIGPLFACRQLSELEIRNVDISQLTNFPMFLGLPNLVRLSISGTKLKQLDPSIGSLLQLKELSLSDNQLTSLPYTISWCCSLESLDLRRNRFQCLPGVLLKLTNLKVVRRLDNNLMSGICLCPSEKEISSVKSEKYNPLALQIHCMKSLVKAGLNHWQAETYVSWNLRYLMNEWHKDMRICEWCRAARQTSQGGVEVTCLMNYCWENSCVPFRLFACSKECAGQLHSHVKNLSAMSSPGEEACMMQELGDDNEKDFIESCANTPPHRRKNKHKRKICRVM